MQDVKEIIMILSKQVLADAELKHTQPKWRSVKDVVSDGLYLHMADGDLEGNSTLTYIRCIDNTWYVNEWGLNIPVGLKQKLNCKDTQRSLFFGPIPEASTKKKR